MMIPLHLPLYPRFSKFGAVHGSRQLNLLDLCPSSLIIFFVFANFHKLIPFIKCIFAVFDNEFSIIIYYMKKG